MPTTAVTPMKIATAGGAMLTESETCPEVVIRPLLTSMQAKQERVESKSER